MSKKEKIFNIFPIVKDKKFSSFGYKTHLIDGTDNAKIDFLKDNLEKDIKDLKFLSIPDSFTVSKGKDAKTKGISLLNYNNLLLNGKVTVLFEEMFRVEDATKEPLFVSTLLEGSRIRFDESVQVNPIQENISNMSILEEIPEDYLSTYLTKDGFDFSSLLNDDFLKAPQLLFQNGFYVSSIKLILSAIDSFAFLEYGDSKNIFKNWIDTYCNIKDVGINSDELWEYRNSLLHMTNNKSRKVNKNQVAPLSFYVANDKSFIPTAGDNLKYFNLLNFIEIIAKGLEAWINTFNLDRNKIETFLKR